jgi:ricin-type beta-trefoil lectin protein
VDVSGAATSAGAKVIQWTCTGTSNQRWIATALSGGGYTIAAQGSGLLLTAASAADGALVTQQPNTNSALQHWAVN